MEKGGEDVLKRLYAPTQEIYCFIGFNDFIIGQLHKYLMCQGGNLFITDEFKSFYYIKEKVKADISYFLNLIFEEDSMGFIPVKRNIRITSEALIDLYNLVYVNEYKTVLQYMENRHNYSFNEKFKKYCYRGDFTIQSKLNIAKDNGFGNELDFLKNGLLKETNKYIHASIFVQPNNYDFDSKLGEAKALLQLELKIYQLALKILCNKYNFDISLYTYNYQAPFEQVYSYCVEKIKCMYLIDMQNPYSFI